MICKIIKIFHLRILINAVKIQIPKRDRTEIGGLSE